MGKDGTLATFPSTMSCFDFDIIRILGYDNIRQCAAKIPLGNYINSSSSS